MAFADFPDSVKALLQANFLVREMEEGLDSILAYRRLAIQEVFPGRIGETMTRTRKGRRAPVSTPISVGAPGATTNLDNGLNPLANPWSVEQYTFTLEEYADTIDLNLMQEQTGIADQFIANARNNGVQAAQSLERICRSKLFGAYLSGNSRIIADPADAIVGTVEANDTPINNAASGNLNLDDVRGFQTVLLQSGSSSGKVVAVSTTNKLPVVITKANGTQYAGNVTAVTVYTYETPTYSVLDLTNTPDAVPGWITFENLSGSDYSFTVGDTIVANDAPAILRPFSRRNTKLLTGSDVLSLGIIEDAVAYLRDNGIPPMDDGTYHCVLDNTSLRQLFADQDFKVLFAGRSQSTEWRDGDIIRLLGITYIPTTEAYVQPAIGTAVEKPAVRVRRPVIAGAESIIQGNFDGMQSWMAQRGFDRADSNIAMVDGVVQIVREPLDRLQQVVAMTWTWIGDYAVPTDITATPTIIPTAGAARYKRCVTIEHAG